MNLFKNNHANQRFFERVHPDVACKKDITKAIQHPDNIQFIKRLTETRSMAYVHLPNDNVVKVVLNKKKKEIVTILPWQDVYKVYEGVHIENVGEVIVELYPDCYMETTCTTTLNKVSLTKYDFQDYGIGYEPISYNSIIFETAIHKAWLQYTERKEKDEEKASA